MMDDKKLAISTMKELLIIPLLTALILGGPMIKNGLEKIVSNSFTKPGVCIQNNDYAPDMKTNYAPEINLLAQAIYGEARGELDIPEYFKGVIGSIVTRAERKGKNITEVILEKRKNEKKGETHHYTCFDPSDVNYKEIQNLSNSKKNKVWEECYSLAERALNNELDLPEVTNYFVGKNPQKYRTKKQAEKMKIPSWAYKMKNGRFVLKHGKRMPVKPIYIVKVDENKSAYFYDFKYF